MVELDKSSGSTVINPANSEEPQHVMVVAMPSRTIKFVGVTTNRDECSGVGVK